MDHELVLELAGVSRQFGAVRALTRRQLRLPRRRGPRARRRERLGQVDAPRDRVRVRRPRSRHRHGSAGTAADARLAGAVAQARSGDGLPGRLVGPRRAGQEQPLLRRRASGARPTGAARSGRAQVLADFDLDLELFPDAPVGTLTMAERQLFEVAKALVTEPKVLLLDEPTTALGPDEVEALHRTVAGVRDARRRRGLRQPSAARSARGRRPDHGAPRRATPRNLRRRDDDRTAAGRTDRRPPVRGGVPAARAAVGRAPRRCSSSTRCRGSRSARSASRCTAARSWRSPAPRATASRNSSTRLAGRIPPRAGRVVCDGKELTLISTHEAVRAGIMLLPGDRKREALMGVLGVRVNATVQSLRRFSRFGRAAPAGRARRGARAHRPTRDPHPVARPAGRVPLRRQPAEGRRSRVRSSASRR